MNLDDIISFDDDIDQDDIDSTDEDIQISPPSIHNDDNPKDDDSSNNPEDVSDENSSSDKDDSAIEYFEYLKSSGVLALPEDYEFDGTADGIEEALEITKKNLSASAYQNV